MGENNWYWRCTECDTVWGFPVSVSTAHCEKCNPKLQSMEMLEKNNVVYDDQKTEVRTTSSTGGQKGVKLQRFDLIPIGPLTRLAEHYGRGAKKYADHQWRQGYEWSKSYAALLRHLTAFWSGEEFDVCPAPHIDKNELESIGAGCAFTEDFPNTPGHETCLNHTGGHHLDAVMWHAFTMSEFWINHPEHDDRFKESK